MPITIDEAIARIPQWAGASSIAASVLPGGVTNVNYRVEVDGQSFVVRIGSPEGTQLGIDREREYRCTVVAGQTGVGPEVVFFLADVGVLVTRFIVGRCPSAAEMALPEMMERVIASMRRYHDGPTFVGAFSPFRALERYLSTARRYAAPLPQDIDVMYVRLHEIASSLRRNPAEARPCHNDLWEPNLIDDGTMIRIVDWEYAGLGDTYFDLANFAIHHRLSDAQGERLLRGYFGQVTKSGFARFKLLELVAQLREAMWCMVGMHVLKIEFDFPGYARTYFDRYRQALDDPRLPVWLAQAASGE